MVGGGPYTFMECLMARNRKKRGLGVADAAAKAGHGTAKAAEKKVVEPIVPKRGPTPKKVKVKRPKYQRPPRTPAAPKAPEANDEKKAFTYAAFSLTRSVAKSIPKEGTKLTDQIGPGMK
jgi:hypothetical protein